MGKLERHLANVIEPYWNYADRCEDDHDHHMNAVLGLVGEAGEVADTYKKSLYHSPSDRREELKLELGDVLFYTMKLIALNNFTVKEILEANKEKLDGRHSKGGK